MISVMQGYIDAKGTGDSRWSIFKAAIFQRGGDSGILMLEFFEVLELLYERKDFNARDDISASIDYVCGDMCDHILGEEKSPTSNDVKNGRCQGMVQSFLNTFENAAVHKPEDDYDEIHSFIKTQIIPELKDRGIIKDSDWAFLFQDADAKWKAAKKELKSNIDRNITQAKEAPFIAYAAYAADVANAVTVAKVRALPKQTIDGIECLVLDSSNMTGDIMSLSLMNVQSTVYESHCASNAGPLIIPNTEASIGSLARGFDNGYLKQMKVEIKDLRRPVPKPRTLCPSTSSSAATAAPAPSGARVLVGEEAAQAEAAQPAMQGEVWRPFTSSNAATAAPVVEMGHLSVGVVGGGAAGNPFST